MNATIIKFNRPLLIATDKIGDDYTYNIYYGFLFNNTHIPPTQEEIEGYVAYLALMSALSNGDKTFTINFIGNGMNLIDQQGNIHPATGDAATLYARQCKTNLNLTFEILQKDIDWQTVVKYTQDDHFIVSESFFYDLQ